MSELNFFLLFYFLCSLHFFLYLIVLIANLKVFPENIWLISLILIFICGVAGAIMQYRTFSSPESWRYFNWHLPLPLHFLSGPFFMFYTLQAVGRNIRKKIPHIIPFMVIAAVTPVVLYLVPSVKVIQPGILPKMQAVLAGKIVFIISLLHTLAYILITLIKTVAHRKYLLANFTGKEADQTRWVQFFISITTVVFILLLSINILSLTGLDNQYFAYADVLVIFVWVLLIGYSYAIEKFRNEGTSSPQAKDKYSHLKYSEEDFHSLFCDIENFIRSNQIHLLPELSLQILAEQTGLNKNELSAVINTKYGENFCNFINRFRIEEAERLLVRYPGKSITEIAFESGFNSKTTFHITFKRHKKCTPSEYRKKGGARTMNAFGTTRR